MKKNHLIWIVAAFGVYYFWKKKHAAPAAMVALPNAQTTLQPPPALPNSAGSPLSGYRY